MWENANEEVTSRVFLHIRHILRDVRHENARYKGLLHPSCPLEPGSAPTSLLALKKPPLCSLPLFRLVYHTALSVCSSAFSQSCSQHCYDRAGWYVWSPDSRASVRYRFSRGISMLRTAPLRPATFQYLGQLPFLYSFGLWSHLKRSSRQASWETQTSSTYLTIHWVAVCRFYTFHWKEKRVRMI